MLCNNLNGKRTWKSIDTCMCIIEPFSAVHLKLTQHCKSTVVQYKIKDFKNKYIHTYILCYKENVGYVFAEMWVNLQNTFAKVKMCCAVPSCLTLCHPMDCSLQGSSVHVDSPGKNTGVGCHALLQGIFPVQELNQCLLHCRHILYQLSYHGSPEVRLLGSKL